MPQRKSILFVTPDYHGAFAMQNELKKLGWESKIYVPADYPERFLFDTKGIIRARKTSTDNPIAQKTVALLNSVLFLNLARKYRYQIHYGALTHPMFFERYLLKLGLVSSEFHFGLWLMRKFGKKIVYVPSGCRDEEFKSVFQQLDEGNVCNNCGFADRCSNDNILPNLDRANKYAHLSVGLGFLDPSLLKVKHFKYKVIDLQRWRPSTSHSNSLKIRVIHSHSLETRTSDARNIKGSPEIVDVMRRIESELPHVEFVELTGLTTNEMLAEQLKADVVIDQIRYGHWGSTGVEAMALGKVLVCYVRPSWEANFLQAFPEYSDLPVVNADEHNLYDIMFQLLNDNDRINDLKLRSRKFAEAHYDPSKNVLDLIKILEEL